MKVLTFSRYFPAYHPRKGEPTYFVEKITRALHMMGNRPIDIDCEFSEEMYYICEPKYHTIRAGNRWKEGDYFSPRVWSGKPYQTKQIQFAPPIQIKKIFGFVCTGNYFYINDRQIDVTSSDLYLNDGLSCDDFLNWFPVENSFEGQILCWNENINYLK